jgi:hypothetical protein
MAFLQPATNNYFGFIPHPVNGGIQANLYLVSSSEAADINTGDLVVLTSIGSVKVAPTGGRASLMAGVSAQYLVGGGGSMLASVNTLSSKMCLIYDDPMQIFVGMDTTSGIAVASSMYAASTENIYSGQTYAVLTTGCINSAGPSSVLHQSVMALSGVVSTYGANTGVFKIIGLHPVESGLSTSKHNEAVSANGVRKFLLRPSTHQLAGPTVVPISTG